MLEVSLNRNSKKLKGLMRIFKKIEDPRENHKVVSSSSLSSHPNDRLSFSRRLNFHSELQRAYPWRSWRFSLHHPTFPLFLHRFTPTFSSLPFPRPYGVLLDPVYLALKPWRLPDFALEYTVLTKNELHRLLRDPILRLEFPFISPKRTRC